jgi:hypothetical protein
VDIPSGWDVEQGPPAEGVTLQPGGPSRGVPRFLDAFLLGVYG